MGWILTQSTTLPSQVVSAGTGKSVAPKNSFVVPEIIASQAVCNPSLYILNSSVDTRKGINGSTIETVIYNLTSAPISVRVAKTRQRSLIKQTFINKAKKNVTDSNGIVWEGGEDSGNKIYLACQLAKQIGATNITLYDVNDDAHDMTIDEGMTVAALIGAAYQTALGTKKSLYSQIKNSTTVSDVQKLIWP